MIVTAIHARTHSFNPPPARGRVSLTATTRPRTADVIVVQVETDAGVTGLGVAQLSGPGLAAAKLVLESELAPLVAGESPWGRERLLAKARHHFRGSGFAGLPALAYSAIDIALWDCCGRAAGVSVAELLGHATPAGVSFFVSEPAGDWDGGEVAARVKLAMTEGAVGVRVEVGTPDVQADADRVRDLHDALGEGAWLGVSAGGRYDLATALALAHFLEDQAVDWFEDPLPDSNLTGYRRLADRLEIPVALGSRFGSVEEFVPVMRDGLASVVRPNLSRLGGLTPVVEVVRLAASLGAVAVPVGPSGVVAHLGAGLAGVTLVDHDLALTTVIAGGSRVVSGVLQPLGPGLGAVSVVASPTP